MPTYGELKPGAYYLIQTDAESDIELITVIMETKETVLLRSYLPTTEDFFRFSAEGIYKLIEELDAETAGKFESLYGTTEAETEEEELFEYEDPSTARIKTILKAPPGKIWGSNLLFLYKNKGRLLSILSLFLLSG